MTNYHIGTVQRLTREYAEAQTAAFWGWMAADTVARQLDPTLTGAGPRLKGQVLRTLDAMSDRDGESTGALLYKMITRGHSRYVPASVRAARRAESERAAGARAELRRAWEEINARLAPYGFCTGGPPHEAPDFDLDTWEQLVTLLETRANATVS